MSSSIYNHVGLYNMDTLITQLCNMDFLNILDLCCRYYELDLANLHLLIAFLCYAVGLSNATV